MYVFGFGIWDLFINFGRVVVIEVGWTTVFLTSWPPDLNREVIKKSPHPNYMTTYVRHLYTKFGVALSGTAEKVVRGVGRSMDF